MSEAYGLRDLGGSAEVAAKPGIRGRRGLRIALLSLAATILLLGAAIAGIFGYRAVNGGQSASAALHLQHVPAPCPSPCSEVPRLLGIWQFLTSRQAALEKSAAFGNLNRFDPKCVPDVEH